MVRTIFVERPVAYSYMIDLRTLRRGKHRMILWPDREADGANESTTPSKMGQRDESGRLEKVRGTHRPISYIDDKELTDFVRSCL